MKDAPRLRLQPRDRELLVALYQHGFLLRDYIHKLFFPDCQLRRVTRRLTALKENGLVIADPIPLGALPMGIGSLLAHPGQYAYRLGEKGVSLVAETLETDVTAVRRRARATPTYAGHAVAVASLRVALQNFQSAQAYRLTRFATEGEARVRYRFRRVGNADWEEGELRPDALARIARGEDESPLFLEADLATQGKVAFAGKLVGYALALETGALTKRLDGLPLRLGIVTTSPARLTALTGLVRASRIVSPAVVGLTTFETFLTSGPLASIWTVPHVGTTRKENHVLLDL
jgi:hypothetical protein